VRGVRAVDLAWLIDNRDEWGQEALGFEFEGDLWYL
jgi:hypothetical protein